MTFIRSVGHFLKSHSLFRKPLDLATDLSNTLISKAKYVLVKIGNFKGFRGTVVRRLRCFGSACD